MANRNTTLQDHSELSRQLLSDVEHFIDIIGERNCTAHLESVTVDGKYLKGRNLGQKPERFVEDHLIFPIIQILGHSLRPRPIQYAPKWTHGRGIPDFSLTTVPTAVAKDVDIRLFGEAKPPNKLHYAQDDVKEYLEKDLDFHAIALLTDGIEWELWIRPRNQLLKDEYTPYSRTSLREALREVKARNLENESYHPHDVRGKIDNNTFEDFTATAVKDIVGNEFGVDLPSDESTK